MNTPIYSSTIFLYFYSILNFLFPPNTKYNLGLYIKPLNWNYHQHFAAIQLLTPRTDCKQNRAGNGEYIALVNI